MTQPKLQALTALLHQIRKDWDLPGIRAALGRATHLGSAADLAVAACRCAADPEMRTPGLIPQPGAHWHGTATGKRMAPTMCPDHPAHKAGDCCVCISLAVPKPEGFVVPRRSKHKQQPCDVCGSYACDPSDHSPEEET